MSASLVGSEMCIRDSPELCPTPPQAAFACQRSRTLPVPTKGSAILDSSSCLLYTSDAADDM
eukprot:13296638-Alexandrium_andersonii.AAC.1